MNILLTILTFISIIYLYRLMINFFNDRIKRKYTKSIVARYMNVLNMCINLNVDIKVMEYDDRYIINTDFDLLPIFTTAKLYKHDKKILLFDKYFKLNDKEYSDIFQLIKSKL